jgi:hypothetical protein
MSSRPLSFRIPKQPSTDVYSKPPDLLGRFFKNPDGAWSKYVPIPNYPIKYLEIGCADGGNAIIVSRSYCSHKDSKIYCVDPWMDYSEYSEYKGEQETAWNTFNANVRNSGNISKFVIRRGLSDNIVPTFEDNFFDIIFVDGNHDTEYVYRDGVMSFQKVKSGGYIIFDDYSPNWLQTVSGVNMFLSEYGEKIRFISPRTTYNQCIIQKL